MKQELLVSEPLHWSEGRDGWDEQTSPTVPGDDMCCGESKTGQWEGGPVNRGLKA